MGSAIKVFINKLFIGKIPVKQNCEMVIDRTHVDFEGEGIPRLSGELV